MFNIKGLKFDASSKFNYLDRAEYNWLNKLANKVRSLPFLRKIEFLDDLADFELKKASYLFVDRWIGNITLRRFRRNLKNGLDYFVLGFKTIDFDSHRALEEFLWKLNRLANQLEKENLHYGVENDISTIREFITLMNKVIDDNYIEEFQKELEQKYGANLWYFAERKWNENIGPFKNPHTGSVSLNRREKWTPELDKEIQQAERESYRKADKALKEDWKKALKILEKNFFSWWS